MYATRRGSGRAAAFTLVELVTVIVILTIVGVFVGGPTLSYIGEMQSGAAASRLTADIRYIQRVAVGSGLRTWVDFDATNNRYSLYIEDPANPGKGGRLAAMHPLDQSEAPVQFGVPPFGGVTIESVDINSTSEIEFDNAGVPYDANGDALTATGTVTLSDGVRVRVHPVGGCVEL